MQKITSAHSHPLYSVAATRQIEQLAAAQLAPHMLMQRAGLAIARLAMALAPHARCIWVACGPGNNGGDGFEAALHLHQWGKTVVLTWTGPSEGKTSLPADAEASRQRALAAGVPFAAQPPDHVDFCIDALLGIGGRAKPGRSDSAGSADLPQWLDRMRTGNAPCLCVDVPSGLNADTGVPEREKPSATKLIAINPRPVWAAARFTLSLLTLKPGLFTAGGRDEAGEVWFDDLGATNAGASVAPQAWLLGADQAATSPRATALHTSHKGSFGDVAVIGGESSAGRHMTGAALLAARAALHAGAGRVFVALLTGAGETSLTVDGAQPELMFRSVDALDLKQQVAVCGCGGGDAIRSVLPRVLSTAPRAVLDADALNAIASDTQLQTLLAARHHRGWQTVLTPHPLEAARLSATDTVTVQADRLAVAQALATRFQCVVVLKGSGTVIATAGELPRINASGNGLLATAGTGDVLAGMTGAYMACGLSAWDAACAAVFGHGDFADRWATIRTGEPFTASDLAGGIV